MFSTALILRYLSAGAFALAYYGFFAIFGPAPVSVLSALLLSFLAALLLILVVSKSDERIFEGTALAAPLAKLASRLLLAYVPFSYFAAFAPLVAAHQNPDLTLISLLFALIFLTCRDSTPTASMSTRYSRRGVALLLVLLFFSAALRLSDLSYNAPFIDELLNLEISSIGNEHFIAADSRLWGVLCRLAYDLGGLSGARAANALLGTVVVLFVAVLSMAFSRLVSAENQSEAAALVAAAAFSLSTPALFTSVLATHDTLSLLFFVSGLSFLVFGLAEERKRLLVLGALLIFFSFAARYAIFVMFPTIAVLTHAPLAMLSSEQRRLVERYFYSPLCAFLTIYFAFDGVHIISSVSLGMELSSGVAERSYPLVVSALLLFTLPLVLLLLIVPLQSLMLRIPVLPPGRVQRMLWVYLLGAAFLLPAAQLLNCSDFGSEKNLSYSTLFASLLLGRLVLRLRTAWPERRARLALSAAGSLLLFLLGMSVGMRELLPRAIRSEHEKALAREVAYLNSQPLLAAFSVPLRIARQRWLSPAQVLEEVHRLGLARQTIAVFGLYGGEHTAWYLTHYLGRDPDSREYYVEQKAPWLKNFFSYVNKKRLPVLIAVLPEVDPIPFERVYRNTGYHFVSSVQLEEVNGPYGRVHILVDPLLLNRKTLLGDWQAYFEAYLQYRVDIPAAAAQLNYESVRQLFRSAEKKLLAQPSFWQQLSLRLEQARAYAVIGKGEKARDSFTKARDHASDEGVAAELQQLLDRLMPEMPPFRVQSTLERYAARGENLLDRATPGSTTAVDAGKYGGRAYWLDFEEPLKLERDAMLRLEFSVSGSRIAGLRLVEQGQEFSIRGYMELLPFAEGRQVVYVPIRDARSLSRLDMQVGPKAWGPLGGSTSAEVEFHSLSVEETTAAELYVK